MYHDQPRNHTAGFAAHHDRQADHYFGLVFIVADQHGDFAAIAAKPKRLAADKIDARNRGANELLDMLDD